MQAGKFFEFAPDLTEPQLGLNDLPELGFASRIEELQPTILFEGYYFDDFVNRDYGPKIASFYMSFYREFIDPKSPFWKEKEQALFRDEVDFVGLDREMVSWTMDTERIGIKGGGISG